MSITIPSSISDVNDGDLIANEGIIADDWSDLADKMHFLYDRSGGRGCGHIWDPPFKTDSGTLTQAPKNNVRPLDHAAYPLQVVRPGKGADDWPLSVFAHIVDATIEWRLQEVTSNTQVASATATTSGTKWATATFNPSDAQVGDASTHEPLEVRMSLAQDNTATAELRQSFARAAFLSASNLPTN